MRIAILGATGLVGRRMLELLADCPWLSEDPLLLASSRSAGVLLPFRGRTLACREVGTDSWQGVNVALFSAGAERSRAWGPVARQAGAWVVDNSSAFRMDPEVPLVVPEINGGLLQQGIATAGCGGLIANPNCSTIQIALAVAPLAGGPGLREVHVTTFQAVSGAGRAAVAEFSRQHENLALPDPDGPFPRGIVRNVIPAIGALQPDGFYEEESKVRHELRKILGCGEDLKVTCTAVRVPVPCGHGAAVRVVCKRPVTPAQAIAAMSLWPGLEIAPDSGDFATPRDIVGRKEVAVGRIRQDPDDPHGLLMWVVADNLLKGAAWNAVQIVSLLAQDSA